MKLDTNRRSSFLLQYELILATHKKQPFITEEVSKKIFHDFIRIGEGHNVTMLDWETHQTYVVVTFKAHPNTQLSKFINAYKSASSRLIKKDFKEIEEQLEDGKFWAEGSCLISFGEVNDELRAEYLNSL